MNSDRFKGVLYGQYLGEIFSIGWSANTDMMILALGDNHVENLTIWLNDGFPELTQSKSCKNITKLIINHPKFKEDPHGVSEEIWIKSDKKLALNSGLLRTIALCNSNEEAVLNFCKITDWDPRCLFASSFLHHVLCNLSNISIKESLLHSEKYLKKDYLAQNNYEDKSLEYADELKKYISIQSVEQLNLNEVGKVSTVLKSLGVVLFILKVIKHSQTTNKVVSFKKVITLIATQGGDVGANCSLAGAVMGGYIGYENLTKILPNCTNFESALRIRTHC